MERAQAKYAIMYKDLSGQYEGFISLNSKTLYFDNEEMLNIEYDKIIKSGAECLMFDLINNEEKSFSLVFRSRD